MKKLLLGVLILMGCGQQTKDDQQGKADSNPIKKISVIIFNEIFPNGKNTIEVVLSKVIRGNKTTLYYIDSLGKGLSLGNFTIYKDTHEYILWKKDRCYFVEEVLIPDKRNNTKVYFYKFDGGKSRDDESLLVFDESKELMLIYYLASRDIFKYDSHEKGKEYFEEVVKQAVNYPWNNYYKWLNIKSKE
ncbi:hypothetical protein GXP67_02745 [Rhodocytophaga rosea]|uniref:Uncharacterized protein n=1 Tax=Rhodocytophaga rosea TaxID=2704465 RepID=A0A6C0GCQ2_9BACT|nr:hypothetical protein [Rhodocytophaga rosea]QHT65658.1 hypothetical protein GXP67_02745 [Rhodocytophaga rosea]